MKNTLSTNSLNSLLYSWNDFKSAIKVASDASMEELSTKEKFPIFVHGLKGSLPSFFIEQYINTKKADAMNEARYKGSAPLNQDDIFLFVSSQKDADAYESDILTVTEGHVEVYQLPWWQTVPYRPAAKGSAIFGMRAGVLS